MEKQKFSYAIGDVVDSEGGLSADEELAEDEDDQNLDHDNHISAKGMDRMLQHVGEMDPD